MADDTENFTFQIITVDGVFFQVNDGRLQVLLIQRGFEPFLNHWALPGAYIPREETSRQALERALVQKTGTGLEQFKLVDQPFAFDTPGRDPRGFVITVVYLGLGQNVVPDNRTEAIYRQNPAFMSVQDLPKLAYDHNDIIAFAHSRLQLLAGSTNVAATLLPATFTLSELQQVYEAIFGKPLDKRNFRKRVLSLGLLEEIADKVKSGAHRPAQLYRFTGAASETFLRQFS